MRAQRSFLFHERIQRDNGDAELIKDCCQRNMSLIHSRCTIQNSRNIYGHPPKRALPNRPILWTHLPMKSNKIQLIFNTICTTLTQNAIKVVPLYFQAVTKLFDDECKEEMHTSNVNLSNCRSLCTNTPYAQTLGSCAVTEVDRREKNCWKNDTSTICMTIFFFAQNPFTCQHSLEAILYIHPHVSHSKRQ